jgi:HD-GYP domain-containing protein (c-di-GMP phosphodiesterase class II)
MTIRMDKLIKTIAAALDIVEAELLGASTHHGKRIAVLTAAMGRRFNLSDEDIRTLTIGALLHDNALTEYILAEHLVQPGQDDKIDQTLGTHCELGQRNLEYLMPKAGIKDLILYHHERADGNGPFNKKEGEYPLGAELIMAADSLDVSRHLQTVTPGELPSLREEIYEDIGKTFTHRAGEALLAVLDEALLASLSDDRIKKTAEQYILPWEVDLEDQLAVNLATLISHIIDYKSNFTRHHSAGIAQKAWFMAEYYNYPASKKCQFHLAAALHDLGKLATPTDILEKPGKLTDEEFGIIKRHVYKTWELLKDIDGMEQICNWASDHHEKLDGTGYPFGKKADELDFNSRLLACIDIYQAVSEERPYHPGRSHQDTMVILYDMADKGFVDSDRARDLDKALPLFQGQDDKLLNSGNTLA